MQYRLDSVRRFLGLDVKFAASCIGTVFATAFGYSAWMLGNNRALADALASLPTAAIVTFGIATISLPLVAPCMLIGWTLGWVVGGLVRLPPPLRNLIAAGFLGGSAVLPFLLIFGRGGYAAENEWRFVVRPLLWIAPAASTLLSVVIYRKP